MSNQSPTNKRLSPLHTHTNYSVLDGASGIDEYVKWCKENGASGLGVTDHGWMIGNLELYKKAKAGGIVPLPGCEFYVAPDKDYQFNKKPYDYYHVTVWAVNETGYRNLLKLGSLAWTDDKLPGFKLNKETNFYEVNEKERVVTKWGTQEKPRITFDELLTHHEGLVLGSGCLIGALSKAFLQGEFKGAERNLNRLLEVYKDRLFMEVMPHICDHDYNRDSKAFQKNECTDWTPDGDLQKAANQEIIKLARKYNLPLLMTVDSHFTTPDLKKVQDILLTNGDPSGWKFYNSYHMMTTEEAWTHWSQVHGTDSEQQKIFTEAVENNDVLVDMARGLQINDRYHQPAPAIPEQIRLNTSDVNDQIKATLFERIERHGRMQWDNPEWVNRLMYEIKVVCDNGVENLAPYFLFLEEKGRTAAEHSIFSAPGRGSGAGSLLFYLLKVAHLDVFEYKLPFERFLSEARIKRGKFPDYDWDMSNRDLLVAILRDELGDRMAQCSTLHTLKLKSAIKDACRSILGWSSNDPRVDLVTKTIANEPMGVTSKDFLLGYTDADGIAHDGHLYENPVLQEFFVQYPMIQDVVVKLLGIPRAVSRHASAYLISDEPISNSVPTCIISGHLCTQYNAQAAFNAVEMAGLIKFDFLSVLALRDIADCIRMVQRNSGYKVWDEKVNYDGQEFTITKGELRIDQLPMPDGTVHDMYRLPEDPKVFEMLQEGKTESLFQVGTPAMTAFTKRVSPETIMEISDIVALDRPGPLNGLTGEKDKNGKPLTMAEAYIERKHERLPVYYAHPGMEPIVQDTYGVFVYQEQLAQAFVDLAGYTAEEADELREILAKKKKQSLEKKLPELRQRLTDRGWTHEQVEVFVSLCIASSAYSFNRSHSAAYATVAYQTAFLKAKFPLEWWCAVLRNASNDDIRQKGYAEALLNDGLLQLPNVNGSINEFKLENGKVSAPLYIIDKVGNAACISIKEARDKGGPFASFEDFLERVNLRVVDMGVMHNLILCGAFEGLDLGVLSAQDLIRHYHYIRKVWSLKIGQNPDGTRKIGPALAEAIAKYQAMEIKKQKFMNIPVLYSDELQAEILRFKALPIYRSDVHDTFKMYLIKRGVSYDSRIAVMHVQTDDGMKSMTVFRNMKEVIRDVIGGPPRGYPAIWVGLIQSTKTFQYTDKKTGEKVTALKVQIVNDGESIECVLWPDLYKQLGQPDDTRIVFVRGRVKESFEPGKFSMSVEHLWY